MALSTSSVPCRSSLSSSIQHPQFIHSNSCCYGYPNNVLFSNFGTKPSFRILADSTTPKARFIARRSETTSVKQLQRPLVEYMSLPASQYSVLDAERIERVDDNTFRCYVYRLKFFAFEVCPVLLVKVEEEPNGCCIRLLSCKLEGSPIVVAQNDKFSASMVNKISCSVGLGKSPMQQLTSDTTIEVLEQVLIVMLPRFLMQLVKDYQAWATGDTSRQPLGTGEI
ncbi:RAP release 2, galactose-binding-like domain protein, putative (DUF1997) isoform X2 [Tasmannia lanceolata]|uniref:RAP release 2, galactose-binding-like domain protein, putative (DUF1997) isoform X2 n=1 Tax=Tasmannia lanceolata TaxID=3420 RepID=UPI00406439A9